MIPGFRILPWAVVLAVFGAMPAHAIVPSLSNSVVPRRIALVGSSGGVIDPAGEFEVIIRDLANLPVSNVLVVVDFSRCSGLRLCADAGPGLTVDCATRTVRGFTNPGGSVRFRIRGHAETHCNDGPLQPPHCVGIFGNGMMLTSVTVAAYDLDGGGLSGADLAAWICDYFGGNEPLRSDFDGSGEIGGGDLSAWLGVFFAVNGGLGSPENCPAGGSAECPVIP